MIVRYFTSIIFAGVVTFSLFWAMEALIASGEDQAQNRVEGRRVEIGEVRQAQETQTEVSKPERPEAEEAPPEMPDIQMDNTNTNASMDVSIGGAQVQADVAVAGTGGFAASDGDYLPIVKVAPVYPRRAAERGIEGYVVLEFTVTKQGTVENIVVVESTSSLFNRAAMKAASKFKYKPKVVDGEPVDVSGVLHKITFELEK